MMDEYGDGRIDDLSVEFARRVIEVEKAVGEIRRSFLRFLLLRLGRTGTIYLIRVVEMCESGRWIGVSKLWNAVGWKEFGVRRRRTLLLISTSHSGRGVTIPSRSSRPTKRSTAN